MLKWKRKSVNLEIIMYISWRCVFFRILRGSRAGEIWICIEITKRSSDVPGRMPATPVWFGSKRWTHRRRSPGTRRRVRSTSTAPLSGRATTWLPLLFHTGLPLLLLVSGHSGHCEVGQLSCGCEVRRPSESGKVFAWSQKVHFLLGRCRNTPVDIEYILTEILLVTVPVTNYSN